MNKSKLHFPKFTFRKNKKAQAAENSENNTKPVADKKAKKSKRKFTQTLSFKLETGIFVLLAVFFVALIYIINLTVSKASIKSYTELSTSISQRSISALSYWLDGYFKDLRIFSRCDAAQAGDVQALGQYIRENQNLVGSDFEFVAVAGYDGMAYASNGTDYSCKTNQYYKEIVERGANSFITNPEMSFATGSYLFYIAIPLTNADNNPFGIIVGALPIDNIKYEVDKINDGIEGYAFILDGNGTIIAHPDSEEIMKNYSHMDDETSGMIGYHDLCEQLSVGFDGSTIIKNINTNQTDYVFYGPISGTSWAFGLSVPESAVLDSTIKTRMNIIVCCVLIVILLFIFISIYMPILLKPLYLLDKSITEIAKGDADLTKRINIKSKDEIGGVVEGFNLFIENLRKIIGQIKNSKATLQSVDDEMQATTQATGSSINQISTNISSVTEQISSQSSSVNETAETVTQIAQNIENLNGMIENQSNGVNQASAAIEQMLENITSVSKNTENMASAFSQLETYTNNGIEKQNDVNQQLEQIEEQSRALFNANKTISKIANETNLLAMNAAIEAAHAGAAGQGFSVVADEIRNLSETSAMQSKTIGAELKKIQDSITTVVASSSEAKEAFNSVSLNIKQTDQLIQQIKAAMEESESGSRQITDALKIMNDSTTEVRSSSSQMSSGNQAILNSVQKLQEATDTIKSSIEKIASDAKLIDENGNTLGNISGTMEKSIQQIGSQIDLFKV